MSGHVLGIGDITYSLHGAITTSESLRIFIKVTAKNNASGTLPKSVWSPALLPELTLDGARLSRECGTGLLCFAHFSASELVGVISDGMFFSD